MTASPRTFEYSSDWHLDAPVEAVWQALCEVETWPRWWPHVRRVETLRTGGPDGLGARRRIDWSTRLPYGFTLDVECTEVRRLRRLRARASGDLAGEGLWELSPAGDATDVRCTWRLDANTRWMRLAAPLVAPVFRWNHEGVMRAGCRGLAWRLGTRSLGAPALHAG